ncbi:hypothetical protein PCE1_004015 [Barthelona sp. PCE]
MRLFVHVSQSAPFMLNIEQEASIEQLNDLAMEAYCSLYDHNPWILKLNRVCSFKGGDVLLVYDKQSVKKTADEVFDISAQERLSLHEEPEPTSTNPVVGSKPGDKNAQPVVRYGTLNRVIIEMTSPHNNDYMWKAFIHTFRQFTTPDILIHKLLERYDVCEPEGLLPCDRPRFLLQERVIIQVKVCRVLVAYLEKYRYEVRDQLDYLRTFVQENVIRDGHYGAAEELRKAIDGPTETPQFVSKGFSKGLALSDAIYKQFWEHSPLVIAEQLTRVDAEIYNQLSPLDFIGCKWNKKKHLVPCLVEHIEFFEKISNFVTYSILKAPDIKARKNVMTNAIQVMSHLHELNNFNGLSAFAFAFSNPPVNRLTKTYVELKESLQEEHRNYSQLMSPLSNYKNYRVALEGVSPNDHCVPFISPFLRDLTFIEDGNGKFNDGLINLFRAMLQYNAIGLLLKFQKPNLYSHIQENHEVMVDIDRHEMAEAEEFFQLSFRIQPRQ